MQYCQKQNKRLCRLAEYCHDGRPLYGQPQGDHWAPTADAYNTWISVGTEYPERLCGTHQKCCREKPQWGQTVKTHPVKCCHLTPEEKARQQSSSTTTFEFNPYGNMQGGPLMLGIGAGSEPVVNAVAIPTEHSVAVADVYEEVFRDFQQSKIWQELNTHTVGQHVSRNLPFAIVLLCRCHRDDDYHIPLLDKLIVQNELEEAFAFLYATPEAQHRFRMLDTYGLQQDGPPALIIDNLPIGQHVAKYLYPRQLVRGGSSSSSSSLPSTPKKWIEFFQHFLQEPTPLQLIVRSSVESAPVDDWEQRGNVWEMYGSNAANIIDSPYHVLLLFANPNCPACHQATNILHGVAKKLAFERRLIVASMDRTANDVPLVVPFSKYPTLLLFKIDDKENPVNFNKEFLNENPDQCGVEMREEDILQFIREQLDEPIAIADRVWSTSSSSSAQPLSA